ncbi:MAG: hypothetical protein Ct9H300mP4_05320 [Gammaproteobacteria bacterium]|nr:MAG: hypothetical protein Ct9H300mP4_05320 [Gammaproteobacteria bacterium]
MQSVLRHERIGQVEQWYRMNKSKSMEEWLEAMRIRSIVSFNAVYADKKKNILFLHNAASPVREESIDWTQPVDGQNLLSSGIKFGALGTIAIDH